MFPWEGDRDGLQRITLANIALKAAGQSWSAVAAHTLENDPETHEEFGSRRYDALTFQEKELLKHRVREGVRRLRRAHRQTILTPKGNQIVPSTWRGAEKLLLIAAGQSNPAIFLHR